MTETRAGSPELNKPLRKLEDVLKEQATRGSVCRVCHKPATTVEDVELRDGITTRLPYCDAHRARLEDVFP